MDNLINNASAKKTILKIRKSIWYHWGRPEQHWSVFVNSIISISAWSLWSAWSIWSACLLSKFSILSMINIIGWISRICMISIVSKISKQKGFRWETSQLSGIEKPSLSERCWYLLERLAHPKITTTWSMQLKLKTLHKKWGKLWWKMRKTMRKCEENYEEMWGKLWGKLNTFLRNMRKVIGRNEESHEQKWGNCNYWIE